MKKKVLMSWSSGKDSAWALYQLQNDPEIEMAGLFSTLNKEFNRVAMHGVRKELLEKQAESIGLPLEIINLPFPCSNIEYEKIMAEFVKESKAKGVDHFAFGDLFLEDVRNYRVEKLKDTGIKPIFPIWGECTKSLSKLMIESGLKTVITCIDPKKLSKEFVGQEFTQEFLAKLPNEVDPCGEKGEFHSFVFDGPIFKEKIDIIQGEIVERDGFVFSDILLKTRRPVAGETIE